MFIPETRFRLRGDAGLARLSGSRLAAGGLNLRGRGLSLVELIVFIAVVSVAVAGVLSVLNASTRGSAEPMMQKQALAIAEALLEEVQLQPFTYCDPDDANAATALDSTGCAATAEAIGPEGAETRTGDPSFDNVNDYQVGGGGGPGLTVSPISNLAGATIAGLEAYSANIKVAGQPLGGIGNDASGNAQSLLVTVTVTGPGNTTVVLDGYRARYAPNALP
jgi:MSHA pilin protein MshD